MRDWLLMTLSALTGLGLAYCFATADSAIIQACKERGYWQTGQTRITCSVEGEKK